MRARRRLLPPRVRVNGGLLPVVTMDDAPIPVVDPRTMFRDCLHCRTSFLSQHGGVRACPVCQAYFNQHGVYPENPQSFACYSGNYRSEEHTSELQSLMRISYAVFCLNKKKEFTRQYNSNHGQA